MIFLTCWFYSVKLLWQRVETPLARQYKELTTTGQTILRVTTLHIRHTIHKVSEKGHFLWDFSSRNQRPGR